MIVKKPSPARSLAVLVLLIPVFTILPSGPAEIVPKDIDISKNHISYFELSGHHLISIADEGFANA